MTNTLHAWSRNTRANPIQKVFCDIKSVLLFSLIKVITKLPTFEQSYKGKVQTHNYINRQNQSTTGKL